MKKTVLITGGSRGIGRASAQLFARQGWNVAVNYLHSQQAALDLVAELTGEGCEVMACQADVSIREQVAGMVREVGDRFGSIEVLINNAGIAQQKLFTDITPEDWDAMLDVNVKGIFNCCQAVVPGMISRKRGKIINLASIWGLTGASCEVHYSTAKAAVIGFTKALARELGPSNIQVNCVAPGIIDTDMNASLLEDDRCRLIEATPLMRFGTPQDIAYALLFLASEQADFLTGQVLSPNGGFVI
ncbi:MAG TPA: 3-oxoacyl-ACP reductase FabG [Syntrophomonadaceae bacterium]|nr:3-oxoacyl-ACP reductase FabG [Syntrophomonadaceae bacterium]